jgi:hypothetical protein
MIYGFFLILFVEVVLLCRLSAAMERSSGEAGMSDTMTFVAVLLLSALIDIIYATVWLIVRHHH